jgi:hypothetical protein
LNTGTEAAFVTALDIEVEKILLPAHAMPRCMQVRISGVHDLVVAPEDVPGSIRLPRAQVVYPRLPGPEHLGS